MIRLSVASLVLVQVAGILPFASASGPYAPTSTTTAAPYFLRNGEQVDLESLPHRLVCVTSTNKHPDGGPNGVETTRNIRMTTIDESKGLCYVQDFLSPEECQLVISFGAENRFDRSPLTGGTKAEGKAYMSSHRTSSTCPLLFPPLYLHMADQLMEKNPFYATELFKAVELTQRAAMLLDEPEANFEPLQMIKYNVGEYYKEHHDHKAMYNGDEGYPDRRRTMLVFLNNVEKGGCLEFGKLGLVFMPRRGDGVVWSNLDAKTGKIDPDMVHQGLPPEEGSNPKFAMNVWIREEPIDVGQQK